MDFKVLHKRCEDDADACLEKELIRRLSEADEPQTWLQILRSGITFNSDVRVGEAMGRLVKTGAVTVVKLPMSNASGYKYEDFRYSLGTLERMAAIL
jgi:hypothetical protein